MATDQQERSGKRSNAEWARLASALLLGGLVVAFALLNRGEVEVNWIFGTWSTPLIVVIVLCLVLGGTLGGLVEHQRRRRRR